MQQNNVRICGGKIMSKKNKPVILGTDEDDQRISEIFTRNVDILGTLNVTITKDTPPVLSVSDDTVFINSDNIFLESKNIDIQGSLTLNGSELLKGETEKSKYKIHKITDESHTIKLDDSKFDIFEGNNNSVITLEMHLDVDFAVVEKTFIARDGFRGCVSFKFIKLCTDETISLGLSAGGQSFSMICIWDKSKKEEWYIKNSGFETIYD